MERATSFPMQILEASPAKLAVDVGIIQQKIYRNRVLRSERGNTEVKHSDKNRTIREHLQKKPFTGRLQQ